MIKPQLGRPMIEPTQEQITNLVYWVGEDISLPNAARHTHVHPQQLDRWMKQGSDDILVESNTIYAQLYTQVRKSQATKISDLLKRIESCPKNWQALAWKLEKCVRDEFGADSVEIKELLERVDKLSEAVKRMIENPLHGVVSDGREMDSKGDQEEGRTS